MQSQQIRVLHIGWQPCPWKPTDLLCPKEPLGMPYAFNTGGHRPICRYTVHAESRSSPTMRSLVAQEDTRSCGTMKCATWQQVCLATCAVMYWLSPPLFLCLVRPSFTDPRMCLPRQGSMSVPVAFGATDSVRRCSTSAFFTPMPPLYGWFQWRASMSSTRRQRGANMSSACETSKELRLYLWYSARQEEWVVPQPSHSSDCQRCLPRKLAWVTQPQSMSFAAVCRSPCCARQSLLYVAHGDDCLMPICSPHSPLLKRGWFIKELSTFIFIFFLLSLSLSRSFFPFSHPFIIFVLLIISSPIKPVSNEASFYFLPSPALL